MVVVVLDCAAVSDVIFPCATAMRALVQHTAASVEHVIGEMMTGPAGGAGAGVSLRGER
jgi:hypothetical protein